MTTLALVGRGNWSQNIRRTLDRLPGVSWIEVGYPVRFGNIRVDGAVIANRSNLHVETALIFLESGVSCFIEKPVATSMKDLERLRSAALHSGTQIFAGHIHLFNPAVNTFLQELKRLGPIISLHGEFANSNPREDVSVIWDWFPHPVSIARRIFTQLPDEVVARPTTGAWGSSIVAASMKFGHIGFTMNASWFSDRPRMNIVAKCHNALLTLDDKAERKIHLLQNHEVSFPPYCVEQPLTIELKSFINVLAGRSENICDFNEAAYVVKVVSALEASATAGGLAVNLT